METDAAWAAGIIDGEGCILIATNGLRVNVSNTSEKMVQRLCDLFGGNIYDKSPKPNRRRAWIWNLNGTKAVPFLMTIKPYVVVKQLEVQLALEYIAATINPGRPPGDARRLTVEELSRREEIRRLLKESRTPVYV